MNNFFALLVTKTYKLAVESVFVEYLEMMMSRLKDVLLINQVTDYKSV